MVSFVRHFFAVLLAAFLPAILVGLLTASVRGPREFGTDLLLPYLEPG
jgi:hypothetical protein